MFKNSYTPTALCMFEKLVLGYQDEEIEKLNGKNYKNGRKTPDRNWKLY